MHNPNFMFLSGLLIVLSILPTFVLVVRHGRTIQAFSFGLYLLSVLIWGFGSIFIGCASKVEHAYTVWKWAYSGVVLIPVTYLQAVMLIIKERSRSSLLLIAYIQAVVFIALTWCDKMFLNINPTFGQMLWPRGGIFYSMSFGVWLLVSMEANLMVLKVYGDGKTKRKASMGALFIGCIGYIGGISNFLPILGLPWRPFGNFLVPCAGAAILYAVVSCDLLGIPQLRRGILLAIMPTFKLIVFSFALFFIHFYLSSFVMAYTGERLSPLMEFVTTILCFSLIDPFWDAIKRLIYPVLVKFWPGILMEEVQPNAVKDLGSLGWAGRGRRRGGIKLRKSTRHARPREACIHDFVI
jgi:hypothetical protein